MTRPHAILLNADGQPVKLGLAIRPSTSAPGRAKVAFVTEAQEGLHVIDPDSGEMTDLPAESNGEGGDLLMLGNEFRIELG